MKKRLVTVVLLILFALAGLHADEIRVDLPKNRSGSLVLPVDSVIGQTADFDVNENVQELYKALKEEYSFDWTVKYIAEHARASLVKLFGTWFSENLPVGDALFSLPFVNADGTVGVNVRVGSTCMAFLLEGNQIVSMRLL